MYSNKCSWYQIRQTVKLSAGTTGKLTQKMILELTLKLTQKWTHSEFPTYVRMGNSRQTQTPKKS